MKTYIFTHTFKALFLVSLLFGSAATVHAQSSFPTGSGFEEQVQFQQQVFRGVVKKMQDLWDRVYESTQEDYYAYSKDGKVRQRMNFSDEAPDKGFLEVAVVEAPSQKEAEKTLGKAIEKALKKRVGKQEVLKDMVVLNQKPLTSKNIQKRVEELKKEVKKTTIQTPQGPKTLYSIKLQFTPNHLRKRAKKYASLVKKYAQRYEIKPELIFAVIHTESFFNPLAKSKVAYGLMQLVPKSGARDAYRKVFRQDKIVKSSYLYDPENNIRLGVAYLRILSDALASIQEPQAKTYLMVSAYNTGLGNVSRAFTGSTRIRSALPQIQLLSAAKVYAHLTTHFPYKETRNYLSKIKKRIPLYR